jgi:hypothetical protein
LCKSPSFIVHWCGCIYNYTQLIYSLHLATCNPQPSSISIKPILKAQSPNQFASSVTRC